MSENLITLYYFTKAEHAFSNMNGSKIKVSNISSLNDTFDIFTPASKLRKERASARRFVEMWSDLWRVLCMSKSWQSPLMWGHYADSHQGICIGFEVDISRFKEIIYIDTRLPIGHFGKKSFEEMDAKELIQMMRYKFSAWSYEEEYRHVVYIEDVVTVEGVDFLNFNKLLRPKQFILGSRCELSNEQKKWIEGYIKQDIDVYRVRSAFNTFKMVKDLSWNLRT